MKWWAWLALSLVLAVGGVGIAVLPASAGTTANITLFATPLFGEGINTFTITYVSETQLKLDWTYGTNVTGVMIRAKYSAYPANILAENETPSDGYLVYTGTGVSVNDISMDFDANPGPLFYRAWAYRADGSWVLTPQQGSEESAIMTLLAFFLLPGVVSFLCMRSSYWLLKFGAGVSWLVAAFYWLNSPPSTVVAASAVHTLMLTLLGFIGLVFIIMVFWQSKRENGTETGRFRMPFSQTDEEVAEDARQRRYWTSHSDRVAAHTDRIVAARRGQIKRRV